MAHGPTAKVRPASSRSTEAAGRPEADAVQPDDAPPDAAALAARALDAPTPEQRVRAIEQLSDVTDVLLIRRTTTAVLGRRGEHPDVLAAALEVLGQQEQPPVEPVLDLLARARDLGTRIRALDFLEEHGKGDARVRAAVTAVARTDRREEVHENAKALLEALDTR
jgi:hypothetical protein